MTAENSTKKLRTEKSKREEETALVIKTILQLVIMAAVAVLFLSGSYLTYSDSTVTIPMTGIDVLTSLFYGGEVGFVNYGKVLYVSIPWYAIGAGLLIVLAAVVFAVWTAISGFAGNRTRRRSGSRRWRSAVCFSFFTYFAWSVSLWPRRARRGRSCPFTSSTKYARSFF